MDHITETMTGGHNVHENELPLGDNGGLPSSLCEANIFRQQTDKNTLEFILTLITFGLAWLAL